MTKHNSKIMTDALMKNQVAHMLKEQQEKYQNLREIEVGELVQVWPWDLKAPILGTVTSITPLTDGVTTPELIYCVYADDKYHEVYRSDVFVDDEKPVKQVGSMSNIATPLFRKVFPQMIANQLVSIQPMTPTTGLSFYLDHTYDKLSNFADDKEEKLED